MSMPLQRRVFSYLVTLLIAFIAVQLLVYTLVEYRGWLGDPHEPLGEVMEEVVDALSLNIVLLPLVVLLAWRLSLRLLAPVHRIADTAVRIGGGRFDERIDTAGMPDDDMRHLGDSINAAFDRYASAVRRLQRFSGDASHQLRTPMAAIRATGEVVVSRPRDGEDYRAAIQDMLSELDRLSFTVEQLLQLSRLESGALRSRFTPWDPAGVIRQCAQLYAPLCEEAGIELECSAGAGMTVSGIEGLAGELLGNLLDNAIRHTPRGGTIRVGVRRAEDSALFYVHDGGPGIPAEYAEAVFERFSQVPGSRQGRAGLGLALAADIAAVHGGTLVVANPGQAGARFECAVPLRAPDG
jgi:two-component system heavy metal sensor histidine kinase CusS